MADELGIPVIDAETLVVDDLIVAGLLEREPLH